MMVPRTVALLMAFGLLALAPVASASPVLDAVCDSTSFCQYDGPACTLRVQAWCHSSRFEDFCVLFVDGVVVFTCL